MMKPLTTSSHPLRARDYITLNAYWFALSFMWNAMAPILLPTLVVQLVPELQKGSALGALSGLGLIIVTIVQPAAGGWTDTRTTRDVDHLILVSDASLRGLAAAESMLALSQELEISVRKTHLIVNRIVGELPAMWDDKINRMGVPLLAKIPYDAQLVEFDGNGRPLVELPTDAPISQAVAQIARQLLA